MSQRNQMASVRKKRPHLCRRSEGKEGKEMKPCRYLTQRDGGLYCGYWDHPLRGDEDIRCCLNGWECYEEPGGCIFEGRWMTLAEYAEFLENKSEREVPEGYEFQDFRLDREGFASLWDSRKRYPVDAMTGEFHYLKHLKIRPKYPKVVKAVAIAHIGCDARAERFPPDRPLVSEWIASLWIDDGSCQVDLVLRVKEARLEFIDGTCFHGEGCPGLERLRRHVLESETFAPLREDLMRELCQATVAPRGLAEPPPSQGAVAQWEEDEHLWP